MSGFSEQPRFNPVKKTHTTVTRKSNKKKRRGKLPGVQAGLPSDSNKKRSTRVVPPELLVRFPNALQEINRRLMGQNFIWMALQLDL